MRRVLRVLGGVGLGVLALVALGAGGALTIARTDRGGRWMRGLLVARLNEQIAGTVGVSSLRLRGWHLTLDGITLRTPEGELVAGVAGVDVTARPLALLRHRLIVEDVTIVRPTLHLVQDEHGLNLARALAPRRARPAPAKTTTDSRPPSLSMSLDRLAVRDGAFDYRGEGNLRHVRADRLAIDAAASYQAQGPLAARLHLSAQAQAPTPAPVTIDLRGRGAGEQGEARLEIRVGDSVLALAMAAAGRDAIDLGIDRIDVMPALVRALAPEAPGPAEPIHLHGHVRRAGPTVTANLVLRAGRGELRADASGDPERELLRGLRVTGHAVDLAALLRDGPRSRIDFALDAHGHGHDLASLRGEVKLEMPPAQLGPGHSGPIRVHARADDDGCKLVDLLAELPGLSLRGNGVATRRALNLRGTLVARDLAATMRAIAAPGKAPPLSGNGALGLQVTGSLARPRLDVRGAFPVLTSGADRIEQLDVTAVIADLRQPALADVKLAATRARFGGRTLREVDVDLASRPGRAFAARVGVAAPSLVVSTRGQWTPVFDGVTVSELVLVYPEARWQLGRPARLRVGGGRFALDDLELTSGSQRIAASLQATPGHVAGKLAVARLDLARLPQALLPPALNLSGLVDADVDVAGPTARPRGHLRAAIAHGRWKHLDGLEVALDARDDGGRVAGTLNARSSQAALSARFNLPASWPPPERAPLTLELTVPPFDVPALLASVGVRSSMNVRGQASLNATVTGTYARPQATVQAHGRGLALRGQRYGDVSLDFAVGTPADATEARLDLLAFGGSAKIEARAPISVARALRLSRPALLRLPVTITAAVDDLGLGPLARLAGNPAVDGGRLTFRLNAHGSARAPLGKLSLRLDGVAGPKFPATDVTLDAEATDRKTTLAAQVSRRAQTLATIDAAIEAPAAKLDQLSAVAAAPLSVRAHLGPLRLQRAALPDLSARDQARVLSGLFAADLEVAGSLRAPRLLLSARAEDARLDRQALGRGQLVVRYQDARPVATLDLASAGGGSLRATASTTLDLGYPGVRRPIDPKTLPLVLDLEAKGLDLGAFSSLVNPVRTVAGRLDANARVRGQVGAPRIDGRVEWSEGRLVIVDLGSYEKIHLLVHGDGGQMVLDNLSARAGEGKAKVTAKAERAGAGLQVATAVKLEKFPLYTDGQPLATLTLDAHANGTATARALQLTTKIDEMRVTLPEGKRKKLQALRRPADVVLLDHGQPLDRAEAKKLRRLAATERADEATPGVPTTPARRIHVKVEAPRNLWIDAPDVHVELGLEDGFAVSVNEETHVFGTVELKRGRLDVLGKRFDVESGSVVRFTGPPNRPTLSVKATHQARSAGIAVRVSLEGPLDHLDLQLSSPDNPNLGDTELLSVLATGHLPDQHTGGSTTPSSAAMSVLGGAIAGQMQKALSKRLPLDVLVIEPGEGLSGSRLEAGTYLTEKLYAAYVGRVGADPFGRENRNEIRLEYQLPHRWSFEGTYGDARRGSGDLVWTKNY